MLSSFGRGIDFAEAANRGLIANLKMGERGRKSVNARVSFRISRSSLIAVTKRDVVSDEREIVPENFCPRKEESSRSFTRDRDNQIELISYRET